MKIGIFTDTYTPDINGVVTSIVTLKDVLESMGHTVFVITNHSLSTTSYENKVLRLPGLELKFLYGYTMSSPVHIAAMDIVRDMELDIIHVHTEFGVGLFARSVAKQLSIPMVSTYHTQYEDYTHYVNRLNLKGVETLSRKLVASMSRFYSKNVQIIISPSEKTKAMLMRYDIRKEIQVIPTGIDLQRFKNVDVKAVDDIKMEYGLGGKFVLTYMGRIAEEKSIDLAIDGFSLYYKDHKNSHFMIVGGGPSLEVLKDKVKNLGIEEAVTFVGPVKPDRVPAFYHASDAFVSASLTETQGLTYIEALACSLCVFARFDKPLEHIVLDGVSGFLFEDAKQMAEKLEHFVNMSEEDKEAMKKNALDIVSTYDSITFGERILEVYQKSVDMFYGKFIITEIIKEDDIVILKLESDAYVEYYAYDQQIVESKELEVGMELSRNEITSLETDQKIQEALQLAFKRLALRDYTSYEITEYLKSKINLSLDQIEYVLDLLKKRRFIDDERYLKERVYYYQEQLRGNTWIVEDLEKRGLSEADIRFELEKEDHADYIKRGLKRGNRIMDSLKDGSKLQRSNKYRQLMMRNGFESDVIKQVQSLLKDTYETAQEKESLGKVVFKALKRYESRYGEEEGRKRTIKYALGKGYPYGMIKEVLEEIEDED